MTLYCCGAALLLARRALYKAHYFAKIAAEHDVGPGKWRQILLVVGCICIFVPVFISNFLLYRGIERQQISELSK